MLASAFVVKEEISVKFMRWKNFEGLFCGFFFPFQELLSAERRTHYILFLSILKEVNWFPVRFSTVINGSPILFCSRPTVSKISYHFFFFQTFSCCLHVEFLSNFLIFRIPKFLPCFDFWKSKTKSKKSADFGALTFNS